MTPPKAEGGKTKVKLFNGKNHGFTNEVNTILEEIIK